MRIKRNISKRLFPLLTALLALVAGNAPGAAAQNTVTFGKSNARQLNLKQWFYFSQYNFDFWYYANKRQADFATRLCIKSYRELTTYFDYRPDDRIQVHFYMDPLSFTDRPQEDDSQLLLDRFYRTQFHAENEHGRYSPYYGENLTHQMKIYYPGDARRFYRHIKTEMARMLLLHQFYSGDNRGSRGNRVSLYLPDWFLVGLSRYLGEGWNAEDEMIMRSLEGRPLVRLLNERAETEEIITLQKSLWHFLALKGGGKRVSELVYMSRLTRSVEKGVALALDYSLETWLAEWADHCRSAYLDAQGAEPRQMLRIFDPAKKNERLAGAALHPSRNRLAFIAEKNGLFELRLDFMNNKKIRVLDRKRVLSAGLSVTELQLPMAWSPDGKWLVAVMPARELGFNLVYFNLYTGELIRHSLWNYMQIVNQIAWSPDGTKLALSATRRGQTDLYVGPAVQAARFKQVTNDLYDDLWPAWKADGSGLYFTSNRDTAVYFDEPDSINFHFVDLPFDLYEIPDLDEDERAMRRLTATPYLNEEEPTVADEETLLYRSDVNGAYNILKYNGGQANDPLLTNYKTGVVSTSDYGGRWLFGVWLDGQRAYGYRKPLKSEDETSIRLSAWAERNAQAWRREQAKKQQADADDEQSQAEQEAAEKDKPEVKYYIFDEEEEDTVKVRDGGGSVFRRKRYRDVEAGAPKTVESINRMRIWSNGVVETGLYFKSVQTVLEIDPLMGSGLHVRMTLEDPFVNHRVVAGYRPFLDFRSSDAYARYQFLKRRLNFETGFERASYYFEEPQRFRIRWHRPYAGVSYPLHKFHRVNLSVGYVHLERIDLVLTDQETVNAFAQMPQARFSYVADNAYEINQYPVKGWRFRFDAEVNAVLGNISQPIPRLRCDLRNYANIAGDLVLASRITAGVSTGANRTLYMIGGYDNWIGQNFNQKDELPVADSPEQLYLTEIVTPLRGFRHNARSGYQFGMANFELRYPLNKLFVGSLKTKPLHNLNLILFYDVGTAWREGNPFSQRNPINRERIVRPPFEIEVQNLKTPFVQGFGAGLRMIVLGYFFRTDLALGVDDGAVSPQIGVSLAKEF